MITLTERMAILSRTYDYFRELENGWLGLKLMVMELQTESNEGRLSSF